jgi:ADP-heptose:LPS heptosyltransferase
MQIKNRNLFRLTRALLLWLPKVFRFLAKFRTPRARLLIIKADAIGDYVLFRNFIEATKTSESYKNHELHLLGNAIWEDLAVNLDSPFVDQFYFINPDELYESPLKTLKLAGALFKNNYELVLQPSFSRTFVTDGLAGFTAAKQVIAFQGDDERINTKYKSKTDKFYTRLLSGVQAGQFEFEKSRFFFERVLNQAIQLDRPSIQIKAGPKTGIVIMPGAGAAKRRWGAEKFIQLIQILLKTTNQHISLIGSPADASLASQIVQHLPAGRISNFTGSTSLSKLVELIAGATLVIANETSAVHIAAAVKTRSICIIGGGHFGRFAPYGTDLEYNPICVYHRMECYNCNWTCKFQTPEFEPFPCVSAIEVDAVLKEVLRLL